MRILDFRHKKRRPLTSIDVPMVPKAGLEPARISTVDFESTASTDFATSALKGYGNVVDYTCRWPPCKQQRVSATLSVEKNSARPAQERLRSHFPLRQPGKLTPSPSPSLFDCPVCLPPSAKRRLAPCSTLSVYLRQTKEIVMSTIKSYAAKEAGADLSLWEYDAGELLPQDVEVQVEYCGICHSDLSMIDNEWGMSSYPLVAGHEVIGRVAALGSAAQDKGLKVGQKVGIGWTARSCGHCDACISGNQINCLEGSVPTIINRGGFADKLRADWQWVIPLPESIDIESAGPMLCGGITVFKPLLMHHVTATSRVGVIGIGGLGHIAIKLLRAMGAEVTAFSSSPAKEQEVLAMGADRVVNSRDPEALKALAGQFDLIINTVAVDLEWQPYFEALAYGGNFHTVGAVMKPLQVPAFTLIGGDRSISGSATGNPSELRKLMKFAGRSKVAPTTELFPMSQINEALKYVREGKARYRVVLKADF